MRVGLTYNLKAPHHGSADERSAEWDEPETIQAVLNAISEGHDAVPVLVDLDVYSKLRKNHLDIVFNIAEGVKGPNRESQIPAMLEFLNIPYTGSDPFTLSACLDKSRTKQILSFHDIRTPRFQVVQTLNDFQWAGAFPAIVKPLWEGSSIGIHNASWVENRKELQAQVRNVLRNYREPALIEEALTGREFTLALLGNGDRLTVLPIVEVKLDRLPPHGKPLYSYEAKWIWDVKEEPLEIFECPAAVTPALKEELENLAKAAFEALGCRDWCRMDIRLDEGGQAHILELNPLPGILPDPSQNSCFPKAARTAGLSYSRLILKVLDVALARYGLLEIAQVTGRQS